MRVAVVRSLSSRSRVRKLQLFDSKCACLYVAGVISAAMRSEYMILHLLKRRMRFVDSTLRQWRC